MVTTRRTVGRPTTGWPMCRCWDTVLQRHQLERCKHGTVLVCAADVPLYHRLHVQCRADGGAETTEREVAGSGQLQLPPGCSVWTPTYRLLPMDTRNRRETHLKSTWTWAAVEPSHGMNWTEGTEGEDTEAWSRALEELDQAGEAPGPAKSEAWLEWEEVERAVTRAKQQRTVWLHLYSLGGLVLTVTAVGAGCLLLRRANKRPRPAQRRTSGDEERKEAPVYYPRRPPTTDTEEEYNNGGRGTASEGGSAVSASVKCASPKQHFKNSGG